MEWHRCNDYCRPAAHVLRVPGMQRETIHAEIVARVGQIDPTVATCVLRQAFANTHSVSVLAAVPHPDETGSWVAYWVA